MEIMSDKQTAKLKVGCTIRVMPGVASPDFSDISFAGWTATIVEVSKKKTGTKYVVEWSESTLSEMPQIYRDRCEESHLYDRMAYLDGAEIEPVD